METSLYALLTIGVFIFCITCIFTHLWVGTCTACKVRHLLPAHIATSYLPFHPVENIEIGVQRRQSAAAAASSPAPSSKAPELGLNRTQQKRKLPLPPPPPPPPAPPSVAGERDCDITSVYYNTEVRPPHCSTAVTADIEYCDSAQSVTNSERATFVKDPDSEISKRNSVSSQGVTDGTIADPAVSDKKVLRSNRGQVNYSSFI